MRRPLLIAALILFGGSIQALETDQYFAWGQPLEDVTDVVNAKVNLEISRALDEINGRRDWREIPCHRLVVRIKARFRIFIYTDLELWATNSRLVDRIPRTPAGEIRFMRESIYRNLTAIDLGSWLPPSPTVRINDVHLGTDKFAHFFSEGWWYYKFYRGARRNGKKAELAVARAINRGILSEKTILGKTSSGVFSPADLEANYQGMRFLIGLCEDGEPSLLQSDDGWRLSAPFDFRNYVSPEWDESYQSSIYTRRLWKRVRPVIAGYCEELETPAVRRQRESYARRDSVTLTERRIQELVETGKLPDPATYSIESICSDERRLSTRN